MDKDIGSLEVGKLADLVIISGNVLKDIRESDKIAYVMINGRLYESPSMNEVVSREKARKPFYFDGKDGKSMPVDTPWLTICKTAPSTDAVVSAKSPSIT